MSDWDPNHLPLNRLPEGWKLVSLLYYPHRQEGEQWEALLQDMKAVSRPVLAHARNGTPHETMLDAIREIRR